MNNEVIFFTKVASIAFFILALFGIYRSLVSQKDAVIDMLREKLKLHEDKIKDLLAQSPDILVKTLSERIEITEKEIERLKIDRVKHKKVIEEKEANLNKLKKQLNALAEIITDTDLVCPNCNSSLTKRLSIPIYGYVGGSEAEADEEYSEYECGFAMKGGQEVSPCKNIMP